MAVKLKIPLIVWGAHQGLDQVGMFSHTDEVEMTRKYRKEHDLMGLEAEDLVDDFDGIAPEDVRSFVYPDDRELERVGVRGIYWETSFAGTRRPSTRADAPSLRLRNGRTNADL